MNRTKRKNQKSLLLNVTDAMFLEVSNEYKIVADEDDRYDNSNDEGEQEVLVVERSSESSFNSNKRKSDSSKKKKDKKKKDKKKDKTKKSPKKDKKKKKIKLVLEEEGKNVNDDVEAVDTVFSNDDKEEEESSSLHQLEQAADEENNDNDDKLHHLDAYDCRSREIIWKNIQVAREEKATMMMTMHDESVGESTDNIDNNNMMMMTDVDTTEKEYFKVIAADAATLGRLMRLKEHSVSTISTEQITEEDMWKLKRGAEIEHLRSTFLKAVNECALMGQMKRPYQEDGDEEGHDDGDNYKVKEKENEQELKSVDKERRQSCRRSSVLTEQYVAKAKTEKNTSWSTPEANLELVEAQEQWATMMVNEEEEAEEPNDDTSLQRSVVLSKLPSPIVPRFDKPFICMSREKRMERLAREVAEETYERFWRIEKLKKLTITERCSCQYCVNPNPHQTHAYRLLSIRQIMNIGRLDNNNETSVDNNIDSIICKPTSTSSDSSSGQGGDANQQEEALTVLPTDLVPTLNAPTKELHHFSFQQVAEQAMERQLQLSRRRVIQVTEVCSCTYCNVGSPSPQQTKRYKELSQSSSIQRKIISVLSLGSTSASATRKIDVLSLGNDGEIIPLPFPSSPLLATRLSSSSTKNLNKKKLTLPSADVPILPPFCSPLSSRKRFVATPKKKTFFNNEKVIPAWATPNLKTRKESFKRGTSKADEDSSSARSWVSSAQRGNSRAALPGSSTASKLDVVHGKRTSSETPKQRCASMPQNSPQGTNARKKSSNQQKSLSVAVTSEEKMILSPKPLLCPTSSTLADKRKHYQSIMMTPPPPPPPSACTNHHRPNHNIITPTSSYNQGKKGGEGNNLRSESPRSSLVPTSMVTPTTVKLDDDFDEEAILFEQIFGDSNHDDGINLPPELPFLN